MDVLEAESADDWETVVSGCFVPLRCAGFEARFTGRMEHVALDPRLSVSMVTTCGTSADRTERLADRANSDDIHLSLQRSSSGTVVADGQSASVRKGSVTVYATDRPYYLDYSRPDQQQLIVQVSRRSLGLPVEMIEDAMRRLALPDGWRAPAARNLFSYAAVTLEDARESTAETMRDLASVMIRSSFGEGSGVPRTSGGLRHAVQEYFRIHATRSGIDMDQIAREHFVSRRRLYQVFEEVGQSPATFLRTERLRRARRLLSDAPDRTIEWIAYESGFRDLTTFTRAFRREHGCTPREWRSQATLAA
ncbi:helix-turn-helix domain-containing protein [Microbacterium fluvii]|uniref:Helix-turn-helix domain-containing protein n=1 Tax=Microbacterium fluvii TaxID=415215 RepID=A0ABW2H8M5_9MICO|nr:helix-turn-helix domain-containing protein [Microbacterium fluvii]MCU4671337.1 helix-turn-helix domain-containing protein [Microbacterium fluvii]